MYIADAPSRDYLPEIKQLEGSQAVLIVEHSKEEEELEAV